ncbi:hypothetical protein DFR30_1807 [Thiogranum longum]|uniref:DUF4412 domain-containing protein n=1 Tax=Thiogranum longum TaxID=1537524 RepID=A0A4R1HGQ9_9GAMM|nr:hypothetical protein [Thiogranum longum]TCK18529.1 hypothetical protein DFR30_1807 [Thiogranum longum]
MKWVAGIILVFGLWTVGYGNGNAASGIQFSGRTLQSAPDGRLRQAKVFVGDNRVRMEYRKKELDIVEIYDLENGRILLLVPQQKLYMQRALPAGKMINPLLPPGDSNPCSVLAEGQCRKLGNEEVYGRPVSRWEVTVERKGERLRSLHWIDDERLMSLRDVWPDGSVSELMLIDIEQLNGRMAEHWQRTTAPSEGEHYVTNLWYDPELGMIVREERPGGYIREIKDIQIGKQPAELFHVPEDYRLIEDDAGKQELQTGRH